MLTFAVPVLGRGFTLNGVQGAPIVWDERAGTAALDDSAPRAERPDHRCPAVASAMKGFLIHDCDEDLAARLRRKLEEAKDVGYDCFEADTFDVELLYDENRVKITEAAVLGYDDLELTVEQFRSALADVAPGPRMEGRPGA